MHGTPHLVSDVMTRTVVALQRGATFKDIVRAMQRRRVSALPVLDGGNRVAGVVSEADLLPKEAFRDGDPDLPRSRLRSTGGDPHHTAAAPVRSHQGRRGDGRAVDDRSGRDRPGGRDLGTGRAHHGPAQGQATAGRG
ncbi:CBS domain-containing protein [Streptomyces sp. NBC_00310]|uniref:CBS domain-containing protein n=1 Tax=Streptomyces sp. NBC_00310 TaxID=2903645 RepID=UPI003FA6A240